MLSAPNGTAKILVVDDSRDSAFILSKLLDHQGHTVRVAGDGPAALEIVEEFQPQIVLLDISLPGMSGHELARQLRRQPGFDSALIVAISGYGSDSDKLASKQAGIDFHLVKPVDIEELTQVMANWQGRG